MNPNKLISKVKIESIKPAELAGRLLNGQPVTVLDVRSDTTWRIEADGLDFVAVPGRQVAADAATLARALPHDPVVVCARGVSAFDAAEVLAEQGLAPVVLDGGMAAWQELLIDFPIETGIDGLDLVQVQRPGRGCLSYLIASGGQAMIVDPAPDHRFYIGLAARLGVFITAVVDTHIHADHVSGARDLAVATGASLRLSGAALDRGLVFAVHVDEFSDGERIELGDLDLRAVALPGHTTDMTGLLIEGRILIGGDSLFAGSVARPDLEAGDRAGMRAMAKILHETIRERILPLGDDAVLLPGHDRAFLHRDAVAPSVGEVRAAQPELETGDADGFTERILAGLPPRPQNYDSIIAVNSGRIGATEDLEAGGNSCAAG